MCPMYESTPTEREGERIDQLVPEAIMATASATSGAGQHSARSGNQRTAGHPEATIQRLKAIAAAEAVALVLVLLACLVL